MKITGKTNSRIAIPARLVLIDGHSAHYIYLMPFGYQFAKSQIQIAIIRKSLGCIAGK